MVGPGPRNFPRDSFVIEERPLCPFLPFYRNLKSPFNFFTLCVCRLGSFWFFPGPGFSWLHFISG